MLEYLLAETTRLSDIINSVSSAKDDESAVQGAGDKLTPRVALARLRLQVFNNWVFDNWAFDKCTTEHHDLFYLLLFICH